MKTAHHQSDEKLLQEWQPEFRIYVRKMLVLGFVTAVILGGFCFYYDALIWLLTLPLFMIAYIFAFDDFLEWPQRRHDRWLLTDQKLVFINPDEEVDSRAIGLDQISRVRKTFWWALSVKMADGQSFTMMFLSPMDEIKTAIVSARDQYAGENRA